MKIIENVFVVPGVTASSYLLLEPQGLTVIDTGLPYSEKRILQYVAWLGRSARDIQRILITHADLDHCGSLAALQKASGARTYAGKVEAEAMARGHSSRPVHRSVNSALQRFAISMMGRFMKATPFQVDEILEDGQVLPAFGGLQVVETPGHSPGHLAYFAPSAGILFCGDSMRSDGTSGLRPSRSRNDWDHAAARRSARKLAALSPRILCPGHGPAVRDASSKFPLLPE